MGNTGLTFVATGGGINSSNAVVQNLGTGKIPNFIPVAINQHAGSPGQLGEY